MNDNEKVAALQEQLLQDVNAAALPLAVKAITASMPSVMPAP